MLCFLHAESRIHIPIYPYKISELDEIVRSFDRHSRETFSENLRIVALKLLKLIRFLSPNLSFYFSFVLCLGFVVMLTF